MTLTFTAPVPKKWLDGIRLVSEKESFKPVFDESRGSGQGDEQGLSSIRFSNVLPELTQFRLELPKDFKDETVFKDAMRHSKPNNIALAMPSVWMHKRSSDGTYIKEWYTNKKTRPDSKLLEEVKETLPARQYALKGYMGVTDCVLNSTIYDYTHSIKHSYFIYTKQDQDTKLEIDDIRKNASENFAFKKIHNQENGIEYVLGKDPTTCIEYHDFSNVPEGVFPPGFTDLQIPILL
jgi:hypothetical protein